MDQYIDPRSVRFKGLFKLRGLARGTVHVALCFTAQLAVALTAHRVGRPDLIRSPTCFRA